LYLSSLALLRNGNGSGKDDDNGKKCWEDHFVGFCVRGKIKKEI
jgi:hypothetical protein